MRWAMWDRGHDGLLRTPCGGIEAKNPDVKIEPGPWKYRLPDGPLRTSRTGSG